MPLEDKKMDNNAYTNADMDKGFHQCNYTLL